MAKGFRIAARALRQLGAELITSDDVALNELIKNAFDARSPRVEVHIHSTVDTHALALIELRLRNNELTRKEAQTKLSRAVSAELEFDQRRILLSEIKNAAKGGRDIFISFLSELRQRQSIEIIDTGKGMSHSDLGDRFLVIGTPYKHFERKSASPDEQPILGDKGIGRLSMMRLGNEAIVTSTQTDAKNWNKIHFTWDSFNNPALFLDDIEVPVTNAGRSDLNERGTRILIRQVSANWNTEKVKVFIQSYMRRLQNPFIKSRRPYPVDITLNGKRQSIYPLKRWLKELAQFKAEIIFDPKGIDGTDQVFQRAIQWHNNSSREVRSWTQKELVSMLEIVPNTFFRLGPFTAHCLWFNRKMLTASGVDRGPRDIRDELNEWCGGFSLYRDNFRVGKTGGMDDDWLEWDRTALKAKGYALNRYQTIGAVAISSKANKHLVDSANREQLIACPEQELLKRLLGDVLVQDLRAHINAVREAEIKITIAEESTNESLKASEDGLKRTLKGIHQIGQLLPKNERHRVKEIKDTLEGQIEYVKTMKNSLSLARETRVELLELANIGLVVEIVIHELTRLTERTSELLSDLERPDSKESAVKVVDNLRSQILATNKRIRTVDAMSPSGRQRKEQYDAVAQTLSIVAGFKNRFQRHEIDCLVTVNGTPTNKQKLEVFMVRGLIAQVLENLLTNSVYWLQMGLSPGQKHRRIEIDIDPRSLTLTVTDNGPGIEPKYADDIFRPYYSTRKNGKGLGLYIAGELVSYHEGKLYLDTSTDPDGRLRTFVLELPRENG